MIPWKIIITIIHVRKKEMKKIRNDSIFSTTLQYKCKLQYSLRCFTMKVFLLLICIYKVIGSSCPNLCSGHGTCETGSCVCYPGWMQGDCSLRINIF